MNIFFAGGLVVADLGRIVTYAEQRGFGSSASCRGTKAINEVS